MRIRFLGTSAGELYPGLWCRCVNCETARRSEDERDRRQSAALYVLPSDDPSDAVLIDFPSEIAEQSRRHGVDLTRLEHLLVSHSHGDHWFPYLLRWRRRPAELSEAPPPVHSAPRFTPLPMLHVYGNAAVESVLRRELGEDLRPYELEFHPVSPGGAFPVGRLRVTALAANHDVGREDAVHYILQDGERTVLYGLDGDTFLPETREALRAYRFDWVILESTFGYGNGGNHRNFARVEAEAEWFRREELLTPNGEIIATHFSPHHCPPHAQTEAYLRERQIGAAWDGMEVEIGPAAHHPDANEPVGW